MTVRGSLPGSALARVQPPAADFRSRVMSNAIHDQAARDVEHRRRADDMVHQAQRDAEAVGTRRRAPSPTTTLRRDDPDVASPPRNWQRIEDDSDL
jgi:hypothetical protein